MWDYLLVDKDDKVVGVLEMKTTRMRNKAFWARKYPDDYKLQASLYAYLLNVKKYFMVTSYLADTDYDHPEEYVCTKDNTIITQEHLPDNFEKRYILQAITWYTAHIIGAISPVPDPIKDAAILSEIKSTYGIS
jgi:hypothetical protein